MSLADIRGAPASRVCFEGEKKAVNRAGHPQAFGDRFLWRVATGTGPELVFRANMQSERWRGRHGFHSRGGTVPRPLT
jgi:hypothetical protein